MQDVESRGCVTVVMWISYLAIVYVAMTSMGVWSGIIAFIVMIPLVAAMGMVWNMFGNENAHLAQSEADIEKRKRERLDDVLRNLSNEDLLALRHRLQDGDINDEILYDEIVGDDGEFLRGQNR